MFVSTIILRYESVIFVQADCLKIKNLETLSDKKTYS